MEPVIMSGSVTNTLAEFQKRQNEIMNDPRLSEAGKAAAGKDVTAQKQAYASKALETFKFDWSEMRHAYQDLKQNREAIAEKAAKSWDYARLNYARESAVGAIRKANTPQEVQQAYDTVKLSGDRHAMRAFAETAASMVGGVKQFSGDRTAAHDLQRAMQSEAEKITTSPDMETQRAAESKLSGQIADLYQKTRQAADEFYPPHLYSGNNPFTDLLNGVKVTERVDAATWATQRSVDVDWD